MDARAIIAALRRGEEPSEAQLQWFAKGLASGAVSDAQAGAFAMAVCLRGLSTRARSALTLAMRDSGAVMRWELPGPVVDKHSTGGVGDCVSLALAPALAACGTYVPMISGRGLGHTGGTLDKLEAVPGLAVEMDEARMRAVVSDVGCVIAGASAAIAPADRRLYAVRDVTATVESIDLICASILSKKLAAGPQVLVLDVKTGSGAFMKDETAARALANALVETAEGAGCATGALITDMSQPLVPSLGNALEVAQIMELLGGEVTGGALLEVTAALGGAILLRAGHVSGRDAGEAQIRDAIASGAAAERFARMLAAQGGPRDFLERWRSYLPKAPEVLEVRAEREGIVRAIDGEALGHLVVHLGGGRLVESDRIDPSVGISDLVALGQEVARGDLIARIHAARAGDAQLAAARLRAAVEVAPRAEGAGRGAQGQEPAPLIRARIGL